jgi:hypothetical protein
VQFPRQSKTKLKLGLREGESEYQGSRERKRERETFILDGGASLCSQSLTARPSGGITIIMKTSDEGDDV